MKKEQQTAAQRKTAERQQTKRDHLKALGLKTARIPCHPDDLEKLKKFGEKLLKDKGISYNRKRGRKPNK